MTTKKMSEFEELLEVASADFTWLLDDHSQSLPVLKKTQVGSLLGTSVPARQFELQGSPPASPASGSLKLYAGADGKLYLRDSAGDVHGLAWEDAVPQGFSAGGRLSLNAVPVETADVANSWVVYYMPYRGNVVWLYNTINAVWEPLNFSGLALRTLDATQTGTLTNGSPNITLSGSSAKFCVGMKVSGTGIPAGAVISNFVSDNVVTLSAAATADGTDVPLTFALPANTNYDLFVYNKSGSLEFYRPVAWANDTTRATSLVRQDGVWTRSGNAALRYVGTIRTKSTDGTLINSSQYRFVYNIDNQVPRRLYYRDATASWSYTGGWRAANNNASYCVGFVMGEPTPQTLRYACPVISVNGTSWVALGESTSTPDSDAAFGRAHPGSSGVSDATLLTASLCKEYLGYHRLIALEKASGDWVTFSSNDASTPNYGALFAIMMM